jgi:DNA-binding CsgD family transcriptional regulator
MAQLAEATDADAAFTAAHSLSDSLACITNSWGIDVKRLATYSDAAAAWTGWLQRAEIVASAPSVWVGEEIDIEDGPLANSTFAVDWLGAQGLQHILIGVLEASSEAISVVVLARGRRRRGRFSAEAKTSLVALLPYLQRNLATSEAARSTRTVEGAAIRVLQVVALGIAIIRADGGVLFANAAANAIINNGDILSLSNGPLALGQPGRPGRFRELLTRLAAMIHEGKQITPQAIAVPRPLRHRPVSLLVWPLAEAAAAGSAEPVAIIFIGDPDRPAEVNSMRLRDLYGLSPKETRVAALLAQGHLPDEVAQILGVAYETVRKHIKNILSKTGSRRQTDLVRMLLSGPAVVSDLSLKT